LVIIQVAIPTKLTDTQKELFQELGDTLGKEVIPQEEKGFFDRLREVLGDALGV
jgi:molecular chaperone DnaJ